MGHDAISPFWEIEEGRFVRNPQLDIIRSAEGRRLARHLEKLDNGLKIFLRGSLLESNAPFERADADLFVLYETRDQLQALQGALPEGYIYDIKPIPQWQSDEDFVYHALLQCRSVQICGPPLERKPIAADFDFAWRHWVKYCPSLIPTTIDLAVPQALIHFKLLVRCFGVLSFLKDQRFTRDLGTCIDFAATEEQGIAAELSVMRGALEAGSGGIHRLDAAKKWLAGRFDQLAAKMRI